MLNIHQFATIYHSKIIIFFHLILPKHWVHQMINYFDFKQINPLILYNKFSLNVNNSFRFHWTQCLILGTWKLQVENVYIILLIIWYLGWYFFTWDHLLYLYIWSYEKDRYFVLMKSTNITLGIRFSTVKHHGEQRLIKTKALNIIAFFLYIMQ